MSNTAEKEVDKKLVLLQMHTPPELRFVEVTKYNSDGIVISKYRVYEQ